MFKGWSWRALITFTLLVLSIAAQSAIMMDPDGNFIPLIHDQTNEDSPHEMFPLMSLPRGSQPEPMRSEAHTPEMEKRWVEMRTRILQDSASRMSPEFLVPEGLTQRTAFWFDIYTRYGEAHHIIHHIRYPWIIFEVVDTTEMLLNGKGPAWLRRDRGSKYASKRAQTIRAALRKLASRKSYDNLPPLEQQLFERLSTLPGPRSQVLRLAAMNVRTQLGQKDFFQRGLVNSSKYLTYMEEEFKRAGLPTELTRMPFVESSFNEDAYSKVGASGIWQIMPQTGKSYMIVNPTIDERNSPLKATAAAARLLRSYYKALQSWPLAITSYNHGIGNIQKAIKRGGSRDLAVIISKYHDGDFRFASSNFFTCFLAALYAEKYHELIFKNIPRDPLQEHEEIRLIGSTNARYLTKITGLSKTEILRYNMDLRHALKTGATLPRGFRLHLPPGYKDRFTREIGTQEKRSKKAKT